MSGTWYAFPSSSENNSQIGTTIRGVQLHQNTATVDLGGSFHATTWPSRIIAVAQIVYTATEQPGVTRVRFELKGQPVDVPRAGDARLTSKPLSRADYPPAALGTLTTTPSSS